MFNKKFLTSLFVTALLAGVVAFYACNDKKDLTPAEDGKNLAEVLCNCFTNTGDDNAKLACITDFESKRDKWRDEADAAAFEAAFNQAIASCANDPYQWYYATYKAEIAKGEFCEFFTANPKAADEEKGFDLLMSDPLGMRYVDDFYNPAFMDAVLGGLLETCPSVPDWFYCSFGMSERCNIELTDEQLAALAIVAVGEFCELATQYPTYNIEALTPLYMQYAKYLNSENPAFLQPFFGGLMACSPASDWILCAFNVKEYCNPSDLTDEELAEIGTRAAIAFCEYFTENPDADMESMMTSAVAKFGRYFTEPAFMQALSGCLLGDCTTVPDWFYCEIFQIQEFCP